MTTSAARSDAPPVRSRRALLAGSVGNFVEWNEFGARSWPARRCAPRTSWVCRRGPRRRTPSRCWAF
ncbi:hypothetical protein CGZ69_31385 [Streptomyces peucetius subsp. caesius ATCC 27952]|nr:hypothetical protein CGZ69_31385 [Streptomyces peucetius subsp. caesius ATCC 27952]